MADTVRLEEIPADLFPNSIHGVLLTNKNYNSNWKILLR